jgi:phosphoglycerate kinase
MTPKLSIEDVEISGRRVLVRVDYNVPFQEGTSVISDDTRIKASIPTLRHLIDEGCSLVLCSHLGRPKGKRYPELSLKPIAKRLGEILEQEVQFVEDCVSEAAATAALKLGKGEILLLENLRFHREEEENNLSFAKQLSELAEVFINDAFGTAHRAHASISGITKFLPSYAGLLLNKEVNYLENALENPELPFTAILGGAKVSDKIKAIDRLTKIANNICIGGGMAATFLAASNKGIGNSSIEADFINQAQTLLNRNDSNNVNLILPNDVVVVKTFQKDSDFLAKSVGDLDDDDIIVDIGPVTADYYSSIIQKSKTILWNGPMGVYEWEKASAGTHSVAKALANGSMLSIIGGGSTVDAVNFFGLQAQMTHVSTGGGASLELLEGRELPGVASLREKTKG